MALLGFMVMVLTILSMDLRISQATSRFSLDKPSSTADYFQQWMIQYSRVYPNESEKQRRFEIFKDNLKYIDYFNSQGNHGFKLVVNQFADQVFSDTHTRLKGVNITSPSRVAIRSPNWNIMSNVDDYSAIDWRLKGAVTGVRNQGIQCGAWAFAVVAAVEGLSKIGRGELIELSKQQLLDCDVDFNRNQGSCKQGTMTKAYNFIAENGIASEEEYPYEFQEGSCQFWARPSTLIRGFGFVDQNNELALMEAVLRQPVSVAVVSNISSFNLYTGGVYDDPDCRVTPLTPLDHAMTLVGFGTTPQGVKYWIAKNSWGEGWGESGYMRIRRDVLWSGGMCGLARFPSYPVPTTVSSGRLIITQSESLQVLFLLFLFFIIIIYLGGFVRVRL